MACDLTRDVSAYAHSSPHLSFLTSPPNKPFSTISSCYFHTIAFFRLADLNLNTEGTHVSGESDRHLPNRAALFTRRLLIEPIHTPYQYFSFQPQPRAFTNNEQHLEPSEYGICEPIC